MNINTGAIALTGAVLLGGLVTTHLWKSVMQDQFQFFHSPTYFANSKNDRHDGTQLFWFTYNFDF